MKEKLMRIVTGLVAALLALSTDISAQEYPHAFPRAGTEKVLENDRVIVWAATWPDGIEQPYHRHQFDMTGVFFRWGPLRVTRLDGTFTVSDEAFDIPWVFFQQKGVTHKEEGVGTPERHAIMIDMKDYDGIGDDGLVDYPPAFPRDGAEEELDSPRVRVWDAKWPPEEVPLHVHTQDTVVVFIDGGTIRMRAADGAEQITTYGSEDVVFISAGTVHVSSAAQGEPRAMFYVLKD